jgi:FKBP-type peptidyl-prolyl cis-trans isomerase SlyD
MHITKDTVVTLSYQVRDTQGKLLEASEQPMAYLHGNTLPKIEAELDSQIASYQTTL